MFIAFLFAAFIAAGLEQLSLFWVFLILAFLFWL